MWSNASRKDFLSSYKADRGNGDFPFALGPPRWNLCLSLARGRLEVSLLPRAPAKAQRYQLFPLSISVSPDRFFTYPLGAQTVHSKVERARMASLCCPWGHLLQFSVSFPICEMGIAPPTSYTSV